MNDMKKLYLAVILALVIGGIAMAAQPTKLNKDTKANQTTVPTAPEVKILPGNQPVDIAPTPTLPQLRETTTVTSPAPTPTDTPSPVPSDSAPTASEQPTSPEPTDNSQPAFVITPGQP